MKEFRINYINFRGELKYTVVEAAEENDAIGVALDREGNYSSDCIQKVVNIEEV